MSERQQALFSSVNDLPAKQRERLEASWAGTFYSEFFCRIDEDNFAVLYSDEASRPNVLVGLEVLKAGFGWSDAQLEEHFSYNMQVRYALGYQDLAEGHLDIRTVYNFRRRLTEHMQRQAKASGQNLRSAVEATVRSLKHPFGNGKLPLRGRPRMSMMMDASAAMTNIRCIWRGQQDKPAASQAENGLWGRLWHSIQTRFWEPRPVYHPVTS